MLRGVHLSSSWTTPLIIPGIEIRVFGNHFIFSLRFLIKKPPKSSSKKKMIEWLDLHSLPYDSSLNKVP